MQKEKNTYVPTVEDRILATELELNVGLALSTENPDTIQELLHRYLDTYIENDCMYLYDMAMQDLLTDASKTGVAYDMAFMQSVVFLMNQEKIIAVMNHKFPEMSEYLDMDRLISFCITADDEDLQLYANFVSIMKETDSVLDMVESLGDGCATAEELAAMPDISERTKRSTLKAKENFEKLSAMIRQQNVINAIQEAKFKAMSENS